MPGTLSQYDKIFNYIKEEFYSNTLYGFSGYNTCYLSKKYRYYIELWKYWYSGYVEDFHQYYYYNGDNRIEVEKKHLNMAKKVAEDKASLLLNEKFTINLDSDEDTEFVETILKNNYFRHRANELVERVNAWGTGAFVEFLQDGEINIDYINADHVIPLTVDNGDIINCAFVSTYRYLDDVIFYLNTHIYLKPAKTEEQVEKRLEQGIPVDYEGYIIENRILKEDRNSNLVSVENSEVVSFILTNTTMPFFQIIKPNIANNVCINDINNGMGISVYANAIDVLCSVDNAYDNLDNEIISGRKRLVVHDKLSKIETSGTGSETIIKPVFDKKDTVYFAMNMGDDVKDPIKEIDMTLRIDECEKAINKQLSILSMRCGLGNNYYRFEGGQVKTATEVISDNNPLFRNIKKDELILKEALVKMTKVILYLADRNIEQDINVNFDDSIFEDTNAIRQNKLLEYTSGIIDKVQYFIDVYKMTEEQAIKHVGAMQARMPQETNIDFMETE